MKTLFLILLIALSTIVYAQQEVASPEELIQFYNTRTYVVIAPDDLTNMVYNSAIKEAVEKRWKSTEFDFISYQEFKEKRKDPNCSFLVLLTVSSLKNKVNSTYKLLTVVLGGKYKDILNMPKLCAIPIAYANDEYDSYEFALPAIIDFMQKHIELTKSDPSLNSKNIMKYYKKNIADINNKTLYIQKNMLATEIDHTDKIASEYKGEVQFADFNELQEVVTKKNANAVVALCVGPLKKEEKKICWKFILGADNGKLYYFNSHQCGAKEPSGFLLKDFKNLNP